MALNQMETEAAKWSLTNRDPVVGFYDQHNAAPAYDTNLFRDFDTTDKIAIEYGCGPGRNLIRYNKRFKRIDGVDIAPRNIDNAQINLKANGIEDYRLFVCDGHSIPVPDESYDVVFSVICLQHICCHSIRFDIFCDAYRVLKKGGYFCFQMGFGKRENVTRETTEYYDDYYNAPSTNYGCDVIVRREAQLKEDLNRFTNYSSLISPTNPADVHAEWIWVQVQK